MRFTSHVTGSLPCMPARHDILCGALDFLWRPWGSIEIWEEPVTQQLRRAGVTTMLVSDHPHLFETGGENYHTDFSAWDYVRGHEGDPWRTYSDPSYIGTPALPARGGGWYWQERLGFDSGDRGYDRSRTFFRSEEDFPGPRTMRTAADWVRRGAPDDTPFLLFVDEFDPHEPFDTPAPYLGRYDPDWEGELLIWPPYDVGAVGSGRLREREGRQIRANYGSKLTMIDHWVAEVFAALEERGLWESTAVIVCTDHGHYLGEKDIWGKPGVMQYEPLGHIPLLVSWPGVAGGGTCDALTTNVDIHATIASVFDVTARGTAHGTSLVPLVTGAGTGTVSGGTGGSFGAAQGREWALGGVFGNWVQVTDGRRKYAAGRSGEQLPHLHVVEPVVDHAHPRPGGPGPPATARPAGPAGLHAGLGGAGHPSTVRARRSAPVLDRRERRGRPLPLRPAQRPDGGREPGGLGWCGRGGHGGAPPGRPASGGGTGRATGAPGSGVTAVEGGGASPFLLPRIPASSGALIFDDVGRLLVVNPTYKAHWSIPGGIMEADGETPWEACRREVREEVGLVVGRGRLVVVDFLRPKPGKPGGLRFLFDCGVLPGDLSSTIVLQEEELSEYRLTDPAEALALLSGPLRRRVGAALEAADCVYLEDGRPL